MTTTTSTTTIRTTITIRCGNKKEDKNEAIIMTTMRKGGRRVEGVERQG